MAGRSIASIHKSENGWRVATKENTPNGYTIRFHHISAWGLIFGASDRVLRLKTSLQGEYVPLSISGEIMSDMDGFVGIIDPSISNTDATLVFASQFSDG